MKLLGLLFNVYSLDSIKGQSIFWQYINFIDMLIRIIVFDNILS